MFDTLIQKRTRRASSLYYWLLTPHCTLLDAGHRDSWRILQTWLEPAFQQVFAHSVGIPLASPFIIYNTKSNRQ